MAKKPDRFDVTSLSTKEPLKYQLLMYEIARLFVEENLSYNKIAPKLYEWAQKNAEKFYCAKGKNNINRAWVIHQMKVIKEDYGFITMGKFGENALSSQIKKRLNITDDTLLLEIAPNDELLLKQVGMRLDEVLTKRVKASANEEVVIGVSGGQTMLALAQTLHDIKTQMTWHKMASKKDKERVVVCSLTSGGTRDNINALSDTVAANIAEELGVRAKGLLGPPSFKDKTAHDAFNDEPEVQKHIDLVKGASIILTSVGNVQDDASLTSQIFNVIDSNYLSTIRKEHKHLGDILYQCYDGYTGEIISHSQDIIERIFLVIKLVEIRERVIKQKTKCILVAKGYEKGYHTLHGAILRSLASEIYMDISCAQGLNDICEQYQE